MEKILIIGGSGLLGHQLLSDLAGDYSLYATYNIHPFKTDLNIPIKKLNILNQYSTKQIIAQEDWSLVLHAASIGDVDFCERNQKIAFDVNVIGTKNIVNACKRCNRRLVYFSTNAVYDGNNGPYSERMKADPINFYGKTKLQGEHLVKKLPSSLILRLNTMYGWNPQSQRDNPATWVIKKLQKREKLKIVDDIYNNHLWAGDVSVIIRRILSNWPRTKFFNLAGKDCISRFEFALKVANVFNLNTKYLSKAKSSDFASLAPRPRNTCFITTKAEKAFNLMPSTVNSGLNKMKAQKLVLIT